LQSPHMRGRVAVPLLSLSLLLLLPARAFAACNYSPVYSAPYRGSVLDLAIDGTNLWTATSYGVSLYDRSTDPPALVASIAIPGITRVVRAANGLLYAGSGSKITILQRNGSSLAIASQVDAGATVNDLV